jgi:hypothetical protein
MKPGGSFILKNEIIGTNGFLIPIVFSIAWNWQFFKSKDV